MPLYCFSIDDDFHWAFTAQLLKVDNTLGNKEARTHIHPITLQQKCSNMCDLLMVRDLFPLVVIFVRSSLNTSLTVPMIHNPCPYAAPGAIQPGPQRQCR